MIKSIELTNFMSHEHTVIEPAEGLTVLVGPNNCGKSAVVAALQILAYNENSKYVVRHGEKECTVRIETDDGHVIQWRRRRDSPSYTIDGEPFDRLGRGGTPEPLAKALRLAKVSSGNQDTDVHFGDQKRPIFLLDSSELQAAQFFASSSDASRFVQMQTLHKQKTVNAQRDKNRLEAESAQLNRELEALQGVTEIDDRLRELEQTHTELCDLARCIEQHRADLAQLRAKVTLMARYAAQCRVLSKLPQPPEQAAIQPLIGLLADLRKAKSQEQRSEARAKVLERLAAPPETHATDALERLIRGLKQTGAAQRRTAGVKGRLDCLAEPPRLADSAAAALALQQEIARLKAATTRVTECDRQRETADRELSEIEGRINQWAEQEQVCPTCGSPIDAERLMERIGGVSHA